MEEQWLNSDEEACYDDEKGNEPEVLSAWVHHVGSNLSLSVWYHRLGLICHQLPLLPLIHGTFLQPICSREKLIEGAGHASRWGGGGVHTHGTTGQNEVEGPLSCLRSYSSLFNSEILSPLFYRYFHAD